MPKHIPILPILMGAMMGVMGLAMLHGALTGQGSATQAGLGFILAHVAVIAAVAGAIGFGLHRRFTWLGRLAKHRPSARHFAIMALAALATAAVIHLVHGGPSWI